MNQKDVKQAHSNVGMAGCRGAIFIVELSVSLFLSKTKVTAYTFFLSGPVQPFIQYAVVLFQ
jgi:hypothetical protein